MRMAKVVSEGSEPQTINCAEPKNTETKCHILSAVIGFASAAVLTINTAFASGFGVWNNSAQIIGNLLTTLEGALKSIVTPVATVCLLIAFLIMMFSRNQKHVEAAKTWAITIGICIIAIYAIPFIISLAQSIGNSF